MQTFTVHRLQQQQRTLQYKQACCSAGRAGPLQLAHVADWANVSRLRLGKRAVQSAAASVLIKQTAGLQLCVETMQASLPSHSAGWVPRQGDSRAVTPSTRADAARLTQHATGRHPRSRLQQGQDAPQVCGRRAAGGRLALQERLLRALRRCAPRIHQALIG